MSLRRRRSAALHALTGAAGGLAASWVLGGAGLVIGRFGFGVGIGAPGWIALGVVLGLAVYGLRTLFD